MKKEQEDKTENQSISMGQSSIKVPRSVKKKDNFTVPISKNSSKFNINLSLEDNTIPPVNNNIINISNIIEDEDPEVLEFKNLKSEYKKLKAELQTDPDNREKKKLKKSIKKRMKQIKENKLKN